MYIIVERNELIDLIEQIRAKVDPDCPPTPNQRLLDIATDVLDYIIEQQNSFEDFFDGADTIHELVTDETIVELAGKIVESILANPVIGSQFQWLKILDSYGSLVIRIKPGVYNGKFNLG